MAEAAEAEVSRVFILSSVLNYEDLFVAVSHYHPFAHSTHKPKPHPASYRQST